jgi:hypothetical protein
VVHTDRLLAAEADRAVQQAGHEVLEADRHLQQATREARHHAVDHRRRDQGLAHSDVRAPVRAVGEQVRDRRGQVVVGVHQPAVGRDDPVAVGVGVVAGGDVVGVRALHDPDQVGHGAG